MHQQNGTIRQSLEDRVMDMAREMGILRTQDVINASIPRVILTRLVRNGKLLRLGRGLYSIHDREITSHHSLAEVAKRVPKGVICLLSALRYHNMTTQAPHEVWVAVDPKVRKPQIRDLPIRVVRFSERARMFGVEHHEIEGVMVRITSPAKTVADCFKYRNKIGLDVAVEALKAYRDSRGSRASLREAAKICRVTSVMQPYMEAIV